MVRPADSGAHELLPVFLFDVKSTIPLALGNVVRLTSFCRLIPSRLEHLPLQCWFGKDDTDGQAGNRQKQLGLVEGITENVKRPRRRESSTEKIEAIAEEQGCRFQECRRGHNLLDAVNLKDVVNLLIQI